VPAHPSKFTVVAVSGRITGTSEVVHLDEKRLSRGSGSDVRLADKPSKWVRKHCARSRVTTRPGLSRDSMRLHAASVNRSLLV